MPFLLNLHSCYVKSTFAASSRFCVILPAVDFCASTGYCPVDFCGNENQLQAGHSYNPVNVNEIIKLLIVSIFID